MNIQEAQRLGNTLKHLPAFRWVDGMRAMWFERGWRVVATDSTGALALHDGTEIQARHVPDLRNPATLGALLWLVREAHNDDRVVAASYAAGLRWVACRGQNTGGGLIIGDEKESEAEALVAALEAAP